MKHLKKPLALALSALLLISLMPVLAPSARAFDYELAAPAAPENPVWDGTSATWDAFVPPEELYSYEEYYNYAFYSLHYSVELFQAPDDGDPVALDKRQLYSANSYDMGQWIVKYGPGKYYFTVTACRYNKTSETVSSPVKEFTAENTPKVPLPMPTHNGWKINTYGQSVASWTAPTPIAPDAAYSYHVTLYKNKELFKEYDFSASQTSCTFSLTDEIPTTSEDVFYYGVKAIPAETETRYTESEENVQSYDTVCPATLLKYRLYDVTVEPCRANDETVSFNVSWSGAYGGVNNLFVKLHITDPDGAETETPDNIRWKLNYVQGSNYRFTFDNYLNHTFKEGEVVAWELMLGASFSAPYATASGSFTVEASAPHTVVFDAQGYGENTSVTVKDRSPLYTVDNLSNHYPQTPGYTITGFSRVKKPMDEYTSDDVFSGKIYEDLTLYAILKPSVDSVEIHVAPPVCGTQIKLTRAFRQGWYEYDVFNAPVITVPENEFYDLSEETEWWYRWATPEPGETDDPDAPAEPELEAFIGKIKGGEQYVTHAETFIKHDAGSAPAVAFAAKDRLHVTGTYDAAEVRSSYTAPTYSYAIIQITVTAVHDWGDGTVTKPATTTEPGEITYTCAGCGETKTEPIPKLTEEQPAFMLGDVDDDGSITAGDARLALRASVGLEKYAPASREFLACDVTVDGVVTAGDARLILRKAVKLDVSKEGWGGK